MDAEIENCDFSHWYSLFKHRTPKTRVLKAPEEFREYLLADGLQLYQSESDVDSGDTSGEDVDDSDSDKLTFMKPPSDFHHLIEQTIAELNGEVAPKLNWSAPRDSTWMLTNNTMRCISANDIYMLLKSSDYINHDLELKPKQLVLVLREWFDIHPSTEFRCFVKNGNLIGISQRDMNFYEFLHSKESEIKRLCAQLCAEITRKFENKSYIADVHIPFKNDKIWLIDLNKFSTKTDSLLFNHDEFHCTPMGECDLRLVGKEDRSRTFSSKPHSTSHVPVDFVDMDKQSLEELITQMKEQRNIQ